MLRVITNTAVIDALERFEVCLETPVIPGEMEHWAAALFDAYGELSPLLNNHLCTVHHSLLQQIAREDPGLLCHTKEMKLADKETLETFERLRPWIEQLPEVATKIEPDEKRLETHVDSLIHDGLEFVMHVRKQETVLNTWHHEALCRDHHGDVD